MDTPNEHHLPTTTSSKEPSSPRKLKTALLAKLALHYYRPDFGPTQVKQLIEDFLDDLETWSVYSVERACRAYRNNPENRFFPTPGQLKGELDKLEEQSIRSHRASQPAFKATDYMRLTGPNAEAKHLEPIGDILRRNGEPEAAAYYEKHGKIKQKRLGQ